MMQNELYTTTYDVPKRAESRGNQALLDDLFKENKETEE